MSAAAVRTVRSRAEHALFGRLFTRNMLRRFVSQESSAAGPQVVRIVEPTKRAVAEYLLAVFDLEPHRVANPPVRLSLLRFLEGLNFYTQWTSYRCACGAFHRR